MRTIAWLAVVLIPLAWTIGVAYGIGYDRGWNAHDPTQKGPDFDPRPGGQLSPDRTVTPPRNQSTPPPAQKGSNDG